MNVKLYKRVSKFKMSDSKALLNISETIQYKTGGSVIIDLLFGVLPIDCGGSLFVFVLLCITLCSF